MSRLAIPQLLVVACLAWAPLQAGAVQAVLEVTAVIPEVAQFRVVSAPQALEITPEDVRRGHVDVPLPSVIAVRSNRSGFVVRVLMDPQLVASATVTGLGHVAQVQAGSGVLRVPGPNSQEVVYELRWRLWLAPQARAGSYAWPVELRLDGL